MLPVSEVGNVTYFCHNHNQEKDKALAEEVLEYL